MSLERIKTEEISVTNDDGSTVPATKRTVLVPHRVKERENWPRFGIAVTKQAYESKESIDIKPQFSTEQFVRYSEASDSIRAEKSEEEAELDRLKRQKELALQNIAQGNVDNIPSSSSTAYVPSSLRDGASGSQMQEEINTTVKVSNIGPEVDNFFLEKTFSKVGRVLKARVVRRYEENEFGERVPGESRGFAFVEFATKDEANKAIKEMHDKIINHSIISVEMSAPRRPR